eukprot:c19437_g1_i4.p1 GENE.c19437_g1_i4~~c19437_g1_i4.p1  ORF type:complete len:164 (+),score=32.42 c19437_g1_i4:158-649(+)
MDPTLEELCNALEKDEYVQFVQTLNHIPPSQLDTPISEDGNSTLRLAFDIPNRLHYAILLLQSGANINHQDFGNTLLHFCSSPIAIRVLVAHGAHVNLPNHDGDSPLMTAAYLGNLDAVNLLLKRGADPLLQNMAGDTALSMAEFLNHQDVVLAIREETSLFN